MPHNIFLHSALVNSRRLDTGTVAAKREAVKYFAIESAGALGATLFINVAVMAVFAVGFHGRQGVDVGLENAGQFLSERFGAWGLEGNIIPRSPDHVARAEAKERVEKHPRK